VFDSNTGSATFQGVVSQMSPDPSKPLDMLFVHGMCTHDADWATEAVKGVLKALGGDPETVDLRPAEVAGTRIVLHQQTLDTPHGRVRANAVRWSPVTAPLKAQLCYDQTDKGPACAAAPASPPYPYARASLNRRFKDSLLNDCLSDAVIYQGKARDEINAQMQMGILQALATTGGRAAPTGFAAAAAAMPAELPLVVVTESLGSKVAFDALYKMLTTPAAAAARRTLARTTQVFMLANQLPILSLADQSLDGNVATASVSRGGDSAYPADPLGTLFAFRLQNFAPPSGLRGPQIVAFTDPNDLLSWALVGRPRAADYPVVDVIVSNAGSILGQLEMPTTAHRGYKANGVVQRLIACGHPGHCP
jgi:hypothetical protein